MTVEVELTWDPAADGWVPATRPTSHAARALYRLVVAAHQRRGDKPSLTEIARVANEALAAGVPVVTHMSVWFGKPVSTVKNWYSQVRAEGLVDTGPAAAVKVIEDHTTNPTVKMPPLAEIAETVKEAYTANRRPVQTVIDRYDCTREQANEWIGLARAANLLPPRDQPQVQSELPPAAAVRIGARR